MAALATEVVLPGFITCRAVAPTVEHRIPNPWVVGSNPSCPAIKPEDVIQKF